MLNVEVPEIQFALKAVSQASRLVKQVQAELVSNALTKDDRSPVTVADFASQALVGSLLDETFPQDPMVGEEDSEALRRPEGRVALEQVTQAVSGFVAGGSSDSVCAWIDRGAYASPGVGAYGTLPRLDARSRHPFRRNVDLVITKALELKGTNRAEIRFEFLNLTNNPMFAGTGTDFGSQAFGRITTTRGYSRITQVSMRYTF